jgi:hypothetical protein
MHLRRWQEYFEDMFENSPDVLSEAPNLLVVGQMN